MPLIYNASIKSIVKEKMIMRLIKLSLESDQIYSTWTGRVKDFGKNFGIVASSMYTYLVFADGKHVGTFLGDGMIYPFSENFKKKPSLFQRKKICHAEVTCLASGTVFDVNWKTSYMKIDSTTSQRYDISMFGKLYFEIGSSPEQILNFYHIFACLNNTIDKEYLGDKLQQCFIPVITSFFERFLSEKEIPLEEGSMLTAMEKLDIAEQICGIMQNRFRDYGVSVSPAYNGSLLQEVFLKKL